MNTTIVFRKVCITVIMVIVSISAVSAFDVFDSRQVIASAVYSVQSNTSRLAASFPDDFLLIGNMAAQLSPDRVDGVIKAGRRRAVLGLIFYVGGLSLEWGLNGYLIATNGGPVIYDTSQYLLYLSGMVGALVLKLPGAVLPAVGVTTTRIGMRRYAGIDAGRNRSWMLTGMGLGFGLFSSLFQTLYTQLEHPALWYAGAVIGGVRDVLWLSNIFYAFGYTGKAAGKARGLDVAFAPALAKDGLGAQVAFTF